MHGPSKPNHFEGDLELEGHAGQGAGHDLGAGRGGRSTRAVVDAVIVRCLGCMLLLLVVVDQVATAGSNWHFGREIRGQFVHADAMAARVVRQFH